MKRALPIIILITSSTVFAGPSQNAATLAFGKRNVSKNLAIHEYNILKDIIVTANVTTNYLFRGLTQTRNKPAAQASLTYTTPLHIYFYFFGSNVQFINSDAHIEADGALGYTNKIGHDFTYDISLSRYTYPGSRNLNYNDLLAIFNFHCLQASLGYSANVYNVHRTGIYYNGGLVYSIPNKWLGVNNLNAQALFGHYSLPRQAGNSYNDYHLQLTKQHGIYFYSLMWTGTNGRQPLSPVDRSVISAQITVIFNNS